MCNMMHFSTVSTSKLKHFQLKMLLFAIMSDNRVKIITRHYSDLHACVSNKIQVLDPLLIKCVSGTIQKCPRHQSPETKE